MTIDENNWLICEGSLTEEQYVDVCKYLVENYEGGKNTAKIMDTAKHLQVAPNMSIWYFVGVLDGLYTGSDDKCKSSVSVITYQQFLEHIKGVVSKANSTPDTPSKNAWINWEGGECPVDPNTTVEVLLDGGATLKGLAKNYNWRYHHEGYPCFPVIKYRVLLDAIMDTNPVHQFSVKTPHRALQTP